jgi:hypothetical protein
MMFLLLNVPLRASDSFILDNEGENETLPIDMADLSENDQWNKLLYKLEKKSKLPQAYFVDYLFYKTHNLLFKNYKKHSKFEEILASGNYDCVSASLAYSLLLQHFDISHSIIETDFHVFIVIRIDNKDYIFESTDPINGFIKNEAQVLDYIANFKPGNKVVAGSGFQGQMEMINVEDNHINTIYKKINLKQLIGLQYYNQAVYAINLHEYQLAKERMGQALKLYPSDRIQSVFQFISKLEE